MIEETATNSCTLLMQEMKSLGASLGASLESKFESLHKSQKSQENKIDSLQKSQDSLQNKMDSVETHLKAAVDDLRQKVQDVDKRVTDTAQEVTRVKISTMKEIYEMDDKRSNVIVFGIPEPVSTGGVSPRDKDAKDIDSIFETIVGRKIAFDLKFRIGQKQDNRIRPIAVKLRELSDKEAVLSSSAALRGHQQWGGVYIKHDLTKFQREFIKKQEDELRAEAATRNSLLGNGEDWEWGIRGRGMMRHLSKVRKVQH